MNAAAFREAYEYGSSNMPFTKGVQSRRYWNVLKEAAAPEHVGDNIGTWMSDQVRCSCGWESPGYWDLAEAAWSDWRQHVADEMGLVPKRCGCGKQYTPFDGEGSCHKLIEIEN